MRLHVVARWTKTLCHSRPRRAGLEMRDDVFAEKPKGVQHLLMLRRPDGAQQDDFLDAEGLVGSRKRMHSSGVPTQNLVPCSRICCGVGSPGCGPPARRWSRA